MDAAIELTGLTKTYGERTVVDLDLTVERGELLAILGPNGAGKTTATEICEGYRRPTTGTVRVLGEDPMQAGQAWRSRIGIVTQETGAFDRLTAREALGHLAGFYPDPLDIDEALALVDLIEQRDQKVDELSGGQRRRLDLACGIIGQPELLFLDEPTTGLDPEVRRRLWGIVDDLRRHSVTIVLTTHYLEEAEALADRVAVIDGGRLVALDTPERLGGRDHDGVVVSFLTPPGFTEHPISLDADPADGDRTSIRTTTPTALIARLHTDLGAELDELTVTRPSLEDVYLRLVSTERVPS
ncbi:MAG: ABC transporter ATP-binding protein [Actinomycetota bacterium]